MTKRSVNERRAAPPYSDEAERGIIGSILMDSEFSLAKCAEARLSEDDFYVPANKTMFEAILKTRKTARGGIVDYLTVCDTLDNDGKLDSVGGIPTIDNLIDNTPTARHIESYLEIVQKKAQRRRMIKVALQMLDDAKNENEPILGSITGAQSKLFREFEEHDEVKSNADAILEIYDELKAAVSGKPNSLPHFLPGVQQKLGGYRKGKLHVIGAPPKKGKTTLICNQAKHWAMGLHDPEGKQIPVAIASIEMDHSEIIGNMVAEHADVSMFAMKTGMRECKYREGKDNRTRLKKFLDAANDFVDGNTMVDKLPLYINDKCLDIDELCSWARLMVYKHGVQALFIDYLQLLREKKFRGSRKEEMDSVVGKLVKLAKETGLVVIVASQFTLQARRDSNNRKPTSNDLKESGSIGEAAYSIILLYEWEDSFYANVDYNRGGQTGEVEILFQGSRQRFRSNLPGDNDAGERHEEREFDLEDTEPSAIE